MIDRILEAIGNNNGKVPADFIDELANEAEVQYLHPTGRTRLCIMTLPTGHEVIGKAQVLDSNNDVESIGNSIAYNDAKSQLWGIVGAIILAIKE